MTGTQINAHILAGMVIEEAYRAIYGGEELICFIAKIGTRKVAEITMGIQVKEQMMNIKGINVESEFRKIGIGRALMDYAEKFVLSKGITKLSLRVYSHDESPEIIGNLRNWYAKMGYVQQNGYMLKTLSATKNSY
ncbi:MAG: GNAT family N-acetyltransferase [Thaumarchaeota archaeon]|nr:GNAT family N-acetyltransferase [Nitrososphaerota archaeon]